MSHWYNPYLEIYEKDIQTVSSAVITHIKDLLKKYKQENPSVSIVVIAHNEERRLLSCLWSLGDQICDDSMELIVVNNNSTDKTEDLLKTLDITYYNETRKGPGFARQCGLNHANGQYVVCIDADTLYRPKHIHVHIKTLRRPGVSCATSLWSFVPSPGRSGFSMIIYEMFRDFYLTLQFINRPELCVRGSTFSFRSEYAKQIGFRTDIIRGEDGSLALALKQYGKIAFIRDRRARVLTGYGAFKAEGSLFNSFKIRLLKAIKSFPSLFSRATKYRDEESNLIDKTK